MHFAHTVVLGGKNTVKNNIMVRMSLLLTLLRIGAYALYKHNKLVGFM